MNAHKRVFGHELKVGDLVVWFHDGRTIKITALRPYMGPLKDLFTEGAQLADCAGQVPSGFTVENGNLYSII